MSELNELETVISGMDDSRLLALYAFYTDETWRKNVKAEPAKYPHLLEVVESCEYSITMMPPFAVKRFVRILKTEITKRQLDPLS